MKVAFLSSLIFLSLCTARAEWSLESSVNLPLPNSPISLVEKNVSLTSGRSVSIRLVVFDTRNCSLQVLDNASGATDLEAAASASGCLAAINGGYFHPDRTPLGLLVSGGRVLHPFERAKLLSGILIVKQQRITLLRANAFVNDPQIDEAIQTGPFLIDHGKALAGLESARRAARTAVLVDGDGKCALMVCDAVTLAEAAELMATPGLISELAVSRALNLDGGSSTALWVKDGPPHWRESVNVRDYLGIKAAAVKARNGN
jgi:uncharacterized protein YigE (DUF2233 family)